MPHSTATHTTTTTTTTDGHQIDVVPLETIDYGRLAAKDPAEIEKLFNAAQLPGFFYLDLKSEAAKQLLTDIPIVFATAKKYFDEPQEVKMKDYRAGLERGYKSRGDAAAFEISREEIVQGTLHLPNPLNEQTPLFKQFSSLCQSISLTLLSSLSSSLNLDETNRLENRHSDTKPNDTGLKLLLDPSKAKRADSVDNTHTDSGTLSLVFAGDEWGIKLEHPETKAWAFIEPKPDCALVNIADSLQALTGGKLHSCRHQVTQAADGARKRYFVAYFFRPDKEEV